MSYPIIPLHVGGVMVVKPLIYVIGGATVGFLLGMVIRLLVTKLVLVPFIVPLVHPSAQTYGDATIITIAGGVIQLACVGFGAWKGYRLVKANY